MDAFFDDVMVNAENSAVRANHHALLAQLRGLFLSVSERWQTVGFSDLCLTGQGCSAIGKGCHKLQEVLEWKWRAIIVALYPLHAPAA